MKLPSELIKEWTNQSLRKMYFELKQRDETGTLPEIKRNEEWPQNIKEGFVRHFTVEANIEYDKLKRSNNKNLFVHKIFSLTDAEKVIYKEIARRFMEPRGW